jgi:hypothetical protein
MDTHQRSSRNYEKTARKIVRQDMKVIESNRGITSRGAAGLKHTDSLHLRVITMRKSGIQGFF